MAGRNEGPSLGGPKHAKHAGIGRHMPRHAGDSRMLGAEPADQVGSHLHDNERYRTIHSKRKKKRRLKRALIVVASVLLVAVVGAGTALGIYSMQLNSRLAIGDEELSAVNDALEPSEVGQPFYALLLGSDSREGSGTSTNPDMMGDNERSDVMILVRVDAPNRKLTMVSIPRDTPYRLEDGSVVKINETYNIEGAAGTIRAVSELTGVPITHFAEVRFSDFQALVDALGGVTVDVPIELSYKDALTGERVTIQPGEQTLNGQQAQIFVRARHEYGTDQDAHRQSAVRQLATAIVKQVLSKPVYEIPDAVLTLADCVSTDMDTGNLIPLAMAFAGGSGDLTIYSGTGPTDGDINEAAGGIWLCYENPDGWETLMEAVDAGEDPSGIDVEDMAIGEMVPQ